VADPLAKAEAADQADVPDGMSLPEEPARREYVPHNRRPIDHIDGQIPNRLLYEVPRHIRPLGIHIDLARVVQRPALSDILSLGHVAGDVE
jgi:hypothetical protein